MSRTVPSIEDRFSPQSARISARGRRSGRPDDDGAPARAARPAAVAARVVGTAARRSPRDHRADGAAGCRTPAAARLPRRRSSRSRRRLSTGTRRAGHAAVDARSRRGRRGRGLSSVGGDRVDRGRRRGRDPRPRQARAVAAADRPPASRNDRVDDGPARPRDRPGRSGPVDHAHEGMSGRRAAARRYRDRHDRESERLLEPYRVVTTARRWYLVARDVERDEWRTLRVDRLQRVEPTGHRVQITDPPDPVALVQEAITTAPYRYQAEVELRAPLAAVADAGPTDRRNARSDRRVDHAADHRRRPPGLAGPAPAGARCRFRGATATRAAGAAAPAPPALGTAGAGFGA